MLYFWKNAKMKNPFVLMLIAVFGFIAAGCEKDDICEATTPTTPRLVIEFYNNENRAELKNVTNLELRSDNPELDSLVFNGVSRILVPLNTMADVTSYTFTLNYNNPNPVFIYTDTLEFNYTRRQEFVSRACGYKMLFDLYNDTDLQTPAGILLNGNAALPPGQWIKDIDVQTYTVENETEVHVKIYH